jgi:TnpA family transposase
MPDQATNTTQKRLRILEEDEIEALYERPHFTDEERLKYFGLSPTEKATLDQFHSIKSRIYFILQLGYFKSHHMFFVFDLPDVEEDAQYIQRQYFPDVQLDNLDITKVTRLRQQGVLLRLCNYRSCDAAQRQALAAKARQAATVSAKPIDVFRELMHYLAAQRVVVPGYTFMQDTVSQALTHEQERLATIASQYLGPSDVANLHRLLEDAPGLYAITQLKREPRDFSASEIKREIQRGAQLSALYHLASKLLPVLKISNESIKYYASLVTYYSVFRLKQLEERTVRIYLLCFVYHRYQRLHDHLINSLIAHVRQYTDSAKEVAKDQVYEHRDESHENLQKAGQVLKLFTAADIAAHVPFHEVQAQAFTILEREKLDFIADHMTKHAQVDETAFQWNHVDTLAPQFKRHLRPILLTVNWAASSGHAPLLEAVHFLQDAVRKGRPLGHYSPAALPLRFIPDTAQRYLYTQDEHGHRHLLPDRYEFLVYRLLRHGLEAGDVFCRDSVRFRSFEDDLLDDQQWQDKETLIANTSLPLLKQPIREHLAQLEQRLEDRLVEVNRRITSGENVHFEIKRRGPKVRWTLQYPRDSEPVNHPFFDTLPQMDISSVLHFANRQCRFMEAFRHVLGRYAKQEADDRTISACLMAWGTNMGLGRMGQISDLGYHTLAVTSENFIRLETLREANDLVSNAIAELAIFRHYDLGGALHSSSDGQKFATQIHTINARYSPKYFGLKKGVVSYSLVANHVPINAEIIGANKHESHYVFDLLFNNTTELQPTIHSTETHGTNAVNFALLHVFGYQFAPRYRDIFDKVGVSLYGFKHPSQYDAAMVLRPLRKLNPDLVVEEWENIQRILVSLALKTTTQNIIVGKLSAFARTNKTRRALWEYDNIIRSLYLLDYIDSPPLRQYVQRALNRGENYHQLRRAVSYANFGKLRFKTEHEQQLWGECARLLTNCIIYYSATILSHMLACKGGAGDTQGVALLKQVSPVAWQHINLYGRYEFRKAPEAIDIDAIVQALSQVPVTPTFAVGC